MLIDLLMSGVGRDKVGSDVVYRREHSSKIVLSGVLGRMTVISQILNLTPKECLLGNAMKYVGFMINIDMPAMNCIYTGLWDVKVLVWLGKRIFINKKNYVGMIPSLVMSSCLKASQNSFVEFSTFSWFLSRVILKLPSLLSLSIKWLNDD